MKVGRFKQALCKGVVSPLPECFMRMDIMSGWGALPLPSTIKQKPINKVLMEARNVRVDEIKVKVYRTDTFEQALCEVVASFLPDCITGMDLVSDWYYYKMIKYTGTLDQRI